MERQEQEEFMKEQCRILFNQEIELRKRRKTIEEALEKMQDEDALERAKRKFPVIDFLVKKAVERKEKEEENEKNNKRDL